MTLNVPKLSELAHTNCNSNVTQTKLTMQAIHQQNIDYPTPQTQRILARLSQWSSSADTQ